MKEVELEVEVREGGFYAGVDFRVEVRPEEVEDNVFGAGGVLEDGEDGCNGATEVVGVEGHGNMDVVSFTQVPVAKSGGFVEDGDIIGGGGRFEEAEEGGSGGGGGGLVEEEEEERQEAEERERRGAPPKGHPALCI